MKLDVEISMHLTLSYVYFFFIVEIFELFFSFPLFKVRGRGEDQSLFLVFKKNKSLY